AFRALARKAPSAVSAPVRGLDAELLERAGSSIPVGSPAFEPRRVPETPVLNAVERDLADERGLQIDPLGVAAARPPAGSTPRSAASEALAALERRQQFPQLTAPRGLERRRVPHVVEHPVAVVKTEQQAP